MNLDKENVKVKPETRNHKGFFVQQADYKLMNIEDSGWALICIDNAVCHYVDPDNLENNVTDESLEVNSL